MRKASPDPAMSLLYILVVAAVCVVAYVVRLNSLLNQSSPEIQPFTEQNLSNEAILSAYAKTKKQRVDVTPYLPKWQQRRYIIVGGSGPFTDCDVVSANANSMRRLARRSDDRRLAQGRSTS